MRSERLLRDTNVAVAPADLRRMDLVAAPGARGPGAHRGRALFCDVSIVSPHTQGGAARPGAGNGNGAVLRAVLQRKRVRYADVVSSGVSHLVVLGCEEVYGRWGEDAIDLLKQLVRSKAREAPPALRAAAAQAWSRRWWSLVGVGVQRAVGESLLAERGPDLLPSAPPALEPTLADLISDHS